LREGLDIPECSLVAILDADKEGFLRSETSLIQTIGRAARHVKGRVILYADKETGSMQRALSETQRRRERQIAHNEENNIIPRGIEKSVSDIIEGITQPQNITAPGAYQPLEGMAEDPRMGDNLRTHIATLEKQMMEAAADLEFETAARLRDEIRRLQETELIIADDPFARQSAINDKLDPNASKRPKSRRGQKR